MTAAEYESRFCQRPRPRPALVERLGDAALVTAGFACVAVQLAIFVVSAWQMIRPIF